jgi:hypothetical protein
MVVGACILYDCAEAHSGPNNALHLTAPVVAPGELCS